MSDISIGIDIGKSGGLAIQASNRSSLEVFPMPMIGTELDYKALYDLLEEYKDKNEIMTTHVVFEKLGVIFGTSKATAFSMGHQAGAVQMCCIALNIPFTAVPPKLWQKDLFLGVTEISRASKSGKTTVRDTKKMALIACKQLFPNQKLTTGDKATKPHDGIVDAILLSEYSRRHY